MKSLSKILKVSLVVSAFIFTNNTNAIQGGGQGTNNNNGQHNSNSGYTQTNGASTNNNGGKKTSVPLDGGLSILLAGAAVFGFRKLRKK